MQHQQKICLANTTWKYTASILMEKSVYLQDGADFNLRDLAEK